MSQTLQQLSTIFSEIHHRSDSLSPSFYKSQQSLRPLAWEAETMSKWIAQHRKSQFLEEISSKYFLCQEQKTKQRLFLFREHQRDTSSVFTFVSDDNHDIRVVSRKKYPTPFGIMEIHFTAHGITQAFFQTNRNDSMVFCDRDLDSSCSWFQEEIFQSLRFWKADISIPLRIHLRGSRFQQQVWQAMTDIPFAGVLSYADLAAYMDIPSAVRAVASAVAKNPLAWFIPCHRVIGKGMYTGDYRWHAYRKRAMLFWEAMCG